MTINHSIKDRDAFLDISKGIAIILVVLGHVLQGSSDKFDDLLGFKVIYAFHMPLFVFLSGAVAGIIFRENRVQEGMMSSLMLSKSILSKAAIRLLLPFISWCMINHFIYHQNDGLMTALITLFRRPDTGLWFLLAIFYCILVTCIFDLLLAFVYFLAKRFDSTRCKRWLLNGRIQILLMICIWWIIREHTPRGAGFGLIRAYFMYYLLGIAFYRYVYPKIYLWQYISAWFIFLVCIPFWSRIDADNVHINSFLNDAPDLIRYFYAGLVALSGSLAVLSIAKWIDNKKTILKNFLVLCGKLSLGIYALHYFFLSYYPSVIAPLLISICISYLISKARWPRLILLGER